MVSHNNYMGQVIINYCQSSQTVCYHIRLHLDIQMSKCYNYMRGTIMDQHCYDSLNTLTILGNSSLYNVYRLCSIPMVACLFILLHLYILHWYRLCTCTCIGTDYVHVCATPIASSTPVIISVFSWFAPLYDFISDAVKQLLYPCMLTWVLGNTIYTIWVLI